MKVENIDFKPSVNPEVFSSCSEVIWVVGYGGAGKSTFAQIAEEFGYSVVGLGTSVRVLYKESVSGQKDKKPTLLEWAQQQIEKIGEVQFAHNMIRHRLSLQSGLLSARQVVIPSIRNPEVLDSLKGLFPNARHTIVFIDAPLSVRAKRIEKRDGDQHEEYDVTQMIERDEAEEKVGLQVLIRKPDAVLKNEGNLEDFKKIIQNFFQMRKSKNE